ncbi:kinase inhibitor [Edwardsiella hoshinae]|uniref:Kinase inhibitor n=1 Tax=Edwardsiella hoshinae TaxID=93378 RepID=A0A376DC40_9GAMM|nr:kinase inhibitor [Edwardsiella hoshinae]AOV96508.1 kinase inhibitor [Edwardsiella hoshinae]QPR27600.1 kinase inhibitor [Edwardsiella hoshinae]STC86734.1 putative kinase inhibitor [Edwardsiella hoshinae]
MTKTTVSLAALALLSLPVHAQDFTLSSPDMHAGQQMSNQQVFAGFGCQGDNRSPALSWSGAPKGTKSFAITAYDPDAPTGSGWWHWTVVNIPADVHHLPANAGAQNSTQLPSGAVQGRNDFGYAGFGGVCPPAGDKPHRYHFTVWALKTDKLPIDNASSGALVGFMLNANKLATAQLVPVYGH